MASRRPGRRLRRDNNVTIEDATPREVTNISGDTGIYFSADGDRRVEELLNVSHKKRRVQPNELQDDYSLWIPIPEDGYEDNGGCDLDGAANTLDHVSSDAATTKRKRYASSDDPMSLWRPMKGFFLDEILWHEGLGDNIEEPQCAHCKTAYKPTTARLFKCQECGEFVQCKNCCLENHARTPLHVIKEWAGKFWVECTLADIGLVYQLGHGGLPCIYPDERIHRLTVIEAPTIYQIQLRYCKCSKSDYANNLQQLLRNRWYPATVTNPGTCATFKTLEAYRLYNVIGNMNVHDFVRAMERTTNTTAASGMTWLPDRYKQFQRMTRQWAFLQRLKRVGRGHDPAGVEQTGLGGTAVNCWLCPQEGKNLPSDWRNVDPKYRFLYMLLLAVDANFKLRNQMRANEIDDPPLGPGWGYWVEPQCYRRHLRKYVAEKDASTCIAFAALLQKDTRLTTGLCASGVGGCVCARHECVRPNGLGDLQKGERYANMDYIVLAALLGFSLMLLTISYDIGCQWKKNLRARNEKMPTELRLDFESFTFQCALPVWHAGSHNEDCQNENSLSFKTGVGKSDGEGVERTWAVLNPAAYQTKDAERGLRADVIEDRIDNHNFMKNLGKGDSLQRKLIVAIAEWERQVKEFEEVSATVERDVRKEWKKDIEAWHADPSKKNPYQLNRQDCPSEAEVRLQVRKDEEALVAGGSTVLQGSSATAFLTAGLQIEDAQSRILAELGGTVLVTADRENKIQEWRHALLVKIGKFRDLQKAYMPGAARIIAEIEADRDEDATPPKPERIALFMPSVMPKGADSLRGCVRGLLDMEAKLRVAQCDNSLVKLRSRLHAKRHLIYFRNEHVTGQVSATKAGALIGCVGERVEAIAKQYRRGRGVLIALKGEDYMPQFRKLWKEDLDLDGDAGDSDAAARKRLAMIGSGKGARAPRNAPGASNVLDMDGPWCHGRSVRVEWARARARKIRWEEEVMTLREEMRRALRYLGWQAWWWREHAALREEVSQGTGAGLRAYALKQAPWHEHLAQFFQRKWKMPVLAAAQHLMMLEAAAEVEGADLDQFFTQHNTVVPATSTTE
ncbi:hypothetical protein DFH07DRAFT_968567 [Mycena maculata]|uniref:CxC2-like cysteine cluster KDZ transposase-associated domain-containing protein n=1 Tax=Mycena maculata TaxID=230809 RepID=A0AAD7HZX9_9AGAR|nr:hypothetical protein DFH07DRAFT_968567 [Mycena maculata]